MKTPISLESDLSPHAEAWIRAKGLTPYAEVPILQRCVDWIAHDGDRVMCVEMKLGLNRKVLEQADVLRLITPHVWCYIGRSPRGLEANEHFAAAKGAGIGIAYFDGQRTVELLQPWAKISPMDHYVRQAIDRTRGIQPGGVSGCPTMLGDGPAQDAYDRVMVYRATNPRATWRDIFSNVPNHYSGPASMAGAMRVVRDVRSLRERQGSSRE